jgi:NADH dehydrogenase/NADH:ubiquinone oxidoreductase subunit G
VRQALRRGAAVGIVGRGKTGLEDRVSALFRPRRGEPAVAFLDLLTRGRRGAGAGEVRRLWQDSHRRLLITDRDAMTGAESAACAEMCSRFGETVRVLGLRGEANAQGAAALGFAMGERGRGLLACIQAADLRALLVLGLASTDRAVAFTLAGKPGFLVVVDARSSPLAQSADVLLPGVFWMEDEGTVVNAEGRVQRLVPAVPPPGGRANWEVLAALAHALGARWRYGSVEDVFAECARANGERVTGYGDLPARTGRLAHAGAGRRTG